MTEDEKKALSFCRYANWLTVVGEQTANVNRIRNQLNDAGLQLTYAVLEAREERECLMAMGVSREKIESLGQIPEPPIDPMSISEPSTAPPK